MREAAAQEAAKLLWRSWTEGSTLPSLPTRCRPLTLEEGWEIQRALDERAGPSSGWKIAGTSSAGQQHIGADGPVVGRLYERCIVDTGALLDARVLTMRCAEPEFAFRMARDLEITDRPFSRSTVLAAVASLHPAIEVPDSRYADFLGVGLPSLVADAMCAAFLVLGPTVSRWSPSQLSSIGVVLRRNGEPVAAGSGSHVLADPCDALVWLANELRARGATLRAGEIVTTGASAPPAPIGPGDHVEAELADLGAVSVTFRR